MKARLMPGCLVAIAAAAEGHGAIIIAPHAASRHAVKHRLAKRTLASAIVERPPTADVRATVDATTGAAVITAAVIAAAGATMAVAAITDVEMAVDVAAATSEAK